MKWYVWVMCAIDCDHVVGATYSTRGLEIQAQLSCLLIESRVSTLFTNRENVSLSALSWKCASASLSAVCFVTVYICSTKCSYQLAVAGSGETISSINRAMFVSCSGCVCVCVWVEHHAVVMIQFSQCTLRKLDLPTSDNSYELPEQNNIASRLP